MHIDFESLTDFVVGTLADAEKAEIQAHLLSCQNCAMQKMRVEKVIGVMQNDQMEDVPPKVVEKTLDLFRKRKAALEEPSLLKRILAVYGNEDSLFIAAFGLRSQQPEIERQMWFKAEDAEISLLVRRKGETWDVAGQVFGNFLGGEAVLQCEKTESKVEMSDLNEFSFTEIPVRTYKSILSFVNAEIEIAEIKIGL